jgi:hypothetical protein
MVDDNQTIIEAYIHADYNMEILGQKWRALTNFLALKKLSNSRLRKISALLAGFSELLLKIIEYRTLPVISPSIPQLSFGENPKHKQENKQPFYAERIQNKSKKHTFIMTHLSPSRFSYPPCKPAMREEEEEVQQQTMHAPTDRNTVHIMLNEIISGAQRSLVGNGLSWSPAVTRNRNDDHRTACRLFHRMGP